MIALNQQNNKPLKALKCVPNIQRRLLRRLFQGLLKGLLQGYLDAFFCLLRNFLARVFCIHIARFVATFCKAARRGLLRFLFVYAH